MILQWASVHVCAHKTNHCSSVKRNHFLFYNKLIIFLYIFRALCAHHQEITIVLSSGIISPVDGGPVHRCTGRPPTGMMIPDAI